MYNFQSFGVDYKVVTLKNGVKVRFLKKAGLPVYIQACFAAGTRFNEVAGAAHFTEHMLVAGTKKFETKSALTGKIEKEGGFLEAFTNPDFLALNLGVPKKSGVATALMVLKEALTNSLFSEKIFLNEQQVILSEIENYLQDKVRVIDYNLYKRLLPDFALRFNTLGARADIEKMQLKEILDFAQKNLVLSRLTYIVTGEFDEEEIIRGLEEINLPAGEKLVWDKFAPTLDKEKETRLDFLKPASKNSGFLLGRRIDTENFEELAGLFLIRQLFVGRNNPFLEELRYKRGFIYGGGTPFLSLKGTSFLGFRTLVATENLEETFAVTLDIFEKIYQKGISEAELEVAKVKLDSYYRFLLQSAKSWLEEENFGLRIGEEGKEINALSVLEKTENLNAEVVTELFRKYFKREEMWVETLAG